MKPTLLVLSVAVTLTATAQADMFKPSFRQQVELGQRAANQIRKEEKVLPASDWRVKMLRRVADRLVAKIPSEERKKKPYAFTFDVVESKEVNAFALPGGPVFFYTGILAKMETEDEVAGVLGHELAHVREEHWASAYADSQKRELGLTALLLLTRANRDLVNLASISNDLIFNLPYSRRNESRADKSGFELVVDAGYNPQGMVNVFEMLSKSDGGRGMPEFLKTHPDAANRVKTIQKMVDDAKAKGAQFPAMRSITSGERLPKSTRPRGA